MTKFKLGDKVKLKADAQDWGWTKEECNQMKSQVFVVGDNKIGSPMTDTVLECVTNYPDDFELVEDIPTEDTTKRHVHHDMIVVWAKDPSRAVQWRDNEACIWQDCSDDDMNPYPVWDVNVQYRFKPEKPERVFPVTSLGLKELASHIISEHETVCFDSLVAIANAAIKQYILDKENILDTEDSKGSS